MKTLIDEFKFWLFQLQLRAEQSSAVALGLYLVFLGLVTLVLLTDVWNVLKNAPSFLFPVLYGVLVLFALGMDYVHFSIVKAQRYELDARRRFIADFHEKQSRLYRVLSWHQKYIIEKNGDGLNIRKVRLGYRNKEATCYEMTFGTNNKYGLEHNRANVKAFSLPDNNKLPRVTFPVGDKSARSLILLDKPLTKNNPEYSLLVQVPIPKVWDDLVRTGKDVGNLVLNHPTDELILEFVAPHGYKFDARRARLYPDQGNQSSYTDDDGNSCLKYTINNPGLGEFDFEIIMRGSS